MSRRKHLAITKWHTWHKRNELFRTECVIYIRVFDIFLLITWWTMEIGSQCWTEVIRMYFSAITRTTINYTYTQHVIVPNEHLKRVTFEQCECFVRKENSNIFSASYFFWACVLSVWHCSLAKTRLLAKPRTKVFSLSLFMVFYGVNRPVMSTSLPHDNPFTSSRRCNAASSQSSLHELYAKSVLKCKVVN